LVCGRIEKEGKEPPRLVKLAEKLSGQKMSGRRGSKLKKREMVESDSLMK